MNRPRKTRLSASSLALAALATGLSGCSLDTVIWGADGAAVITTTDEVIVAAQAGEADAFACEDGVADFGAPGDWEGLEPGEPEELAVEPEAEFSQQPRELLAVTPREGVEKFGLSIHQSRDGRVDPQSSVSGEGDQDAAPVVGVIFAVHQPTLDEPVDAVGHGAARDQSLLQKLLRAELERLARAAQSRQHIPLPRLKFAPAERIASRPIEMT